MKLLKDFQNKLESIKNLDQSSLDYLSSEYSSLKDLTCITIVVSDYVGNKTKHHSLTVESLIFLVQLLQLQESEKCRDEK